MGVLLLMAIYFGVERTTFLDNSFQIVRMTMIDEIDAMADRYVSMIVRVWPYVMLKLGAPLRWVLVSFSLSYMLYNAVLYYIVSYKMKRPYIGFLIPATFGMIVIYGFYWCNSELFQLCSLATLFYAVLTQELKMRAKNVFLGLMVGLSFFTHPLTVVLLPFLVGFEMFTRSEQRKYWFWIPLIVLLHFLKSKFLPNWYDVSKTKEFGGNVETYGWKIWEIPSLQSFFEDWTVSALPILLLILAIAMCWYLKKYWGALVVLGAFVIYLAIVHLGDSPGNYRFYIQTNRLPLSWMSLAVICRLLPDVKWKYLLPLLLLLIIIGLGNIINLSAFFQKRIVYIEQLTVKSSPKEYMHFDEVDMDVVVQPWGMAAESLILSNLNPNLESKTIFLSNDSTEVKQLGSKAYQACFHPYNENISFYFEIAEDTY